MGWVSIKDTARLYGLSQNTVRTRIANRDQFTLTKKIKNKVHIWIDDQPDSTLTKKQTTENERAVMYAALSPNVSVTRTMVAEVFNISDSFLNELQNGTIKVYKDSSNTHDLQELLVKARYYRYKKKLTYRDIGEKLGVSATTVWNLLKSNKECYKRIRKNA